MCPLDTGKASLMAIHRLFSAIICSGARWQNMQLVCAFIDAIFDISIVQSPCCRLFVPLGRMSGGIFPGICVVAFPGVP